MNEGLQASAQGGLVRVQVTEGDFFSKIAAGEVPGTAPLNKFGRNIDVDTGSTPEDVWDAGSVWVPPTTARVHNLVSTDADDAAAGTGARTVEVFGLTSWTELPTSEIVPLDGVTPVATVNSYVIIYRMECLTFGSSATNEGTITATAVTDATVTAQISIGFGQTLMAIFAVSSKQRLDMTQWYMDWNRSAGAANSADMNLLVNRRPDQADGGFVVKHHLGLFGSGNTYIPHQFRPYFTIAGPAIIKVKVENVSANNTDISAGFDGMVVQV